MKLARSSLSLVVSRANSESMNLRVRAPGFVSSSVVFRRCVRTSCGSSSDCGGRGERLVVDVRITPRDDEITRTELFIEIPISNYHRHLGAVEFLRSFSPPHIRDVESVTYPAVSARGPTGLDSQPASPKVSASSPPARLPEPSQHTTQTAINYLINWRISRRKVRN